MKQSIVKAEKYIILKIEEEKVDATISPELKAIFVNFKSEGMKNLILDLQLVKYVDSSGLSALLIANRMCQENGGILVLSYISEHVMKLIKISQLEKVLHLAQNREEAIDLIFMTELENDLEKEVD